MHFCDSYQEATQMQEEEKSITSKIANYFDVDENIKPSETAGFRKLMIVF